MNQLDTFLVSEIRGLIRRFFMEQKLATVSQSADVLFMMLGAVMVFALASIAAIFFLILDQILRFLLNLVLTINF